MSRLLLVLFVCGVVSAQARAYDEPPLQSYTRITPNKKFVFAMLYQPVRKGERDQVAEKYPKSGLYLNNDGGLAKAIWELDGGYAREAFPASDGVHVVLQHERVITHNGRCGNGSVEPPENPIVLTFYTSGKKTRDVVLSEVLDNARFCRDKGPGWHPWLHSAQIDDTAGTFNVVNVYDSTIRFELATGHQPGGPVVFCGNSGDGRSYRGILLGVGLAFAAAVGFTVLAIFLLRSTHSTSP